MPIDRSKLLRRSFVTIWIVVCFIVVVFTYQSRKALPAGISYAGAEHPTTDVRFLADLTYVDQNGRRIVEQEIFDEVFAIIAGARRFVLLDMFLYNPFQGPVPETTRALSDELTNALLAQKREFPDIEIVVITDPINTVYGGMASAQLDALEAAGIGVVTTNLEVLRDSNPIYSSLWRLLIRPFGNGRAETLPNPFGPGRVSVRSYLDLLNFKANHRKTILADEGDGLVGLVTSANPHDGSSAHGNLAIQFTGAAVVDLLETENAVLRFSGAMPLDAGAVPEPQHSRVTVQVLTEAKIEEAVLDAIATAEPGDSLSLAMFYLSDRHVIEAIESAHERGVAARVLLDPNRDAFGRQKNGVPGRPVAHELHDAGIDVRWCDTHGEQCHMKMLLVDYRDGSSVLIGGSANFTRRNLENFNLETDLAVRGPRESPAIADARAFFELIWHNEPGRRFSTDYSALADESVTKLILYRLMESSGISTF
jgi:phosphatidylserine/phosphatidylglycerophosphate/cardiolipin synthase-like enzyme